MPLDADFHDERWSGNTKNRRSFWTLIKADQFGSIKIIILLVLNKIQRFISVNQIWSASPKSLGFKTMPQINCGISSNLMPITQNSQQTLQSQQEDAQWNTTQPEVGRSGITWLTTQHCKGMFWLQIMAISPDTCEQCQSEAMVIRYNATTPLENQLT